MSSDAVARSVAKKLFYYFEVKRREDGFDLSNSSPLRSAARPTLQYDGLHDRPLVHYFSSPDVKAKITNLGPGHNIKKGSHRENHIRKYFEQYMKSRPKSANPYLSDTSNGASLRLSTTSSAVPTKSRGKHRTLKGLQPTIRTAPPNYISARGEANRLVNMAARLLVEMETLDDIKPSRPSAFNRQFSNKQKSQSLPHIDSSSDGSTRPKTARGGRPYSSSPRTSGRFNSIPPEDDSSSASSQKHDTRTRQKHGSTLTTQNHWLRGSPPTATTSSDSESTDRVPQPPSEKPTRKLRPKSSKYRKRAGHGDGKTTSSGTTMNVSDFPHGISDGVSVEDSSQTIETVGVQTERKLIDNYDQQENIAVEGPLRDYHVYVRTGTRIGASTKADVKITLYGDKGRSKEILLGESRRHKIKFQKGKEDDFTVHLPHVGHMTKVKIGHDRPDLSYAWYLDGVSVHDVYSERIYEFPCEKWLSGQDGDKHTYRELTLDRDRAYVEDSDTGSDVSFIMKHSTHTLNPGPAQAVPVTVDQQSTVSDTISVEVQHSEKQGSEEKKQDSESDSDTGSDTGSTHSSDSDSDSSDTTRNHSDRETLVSSPRRDDAKQTAEDQLAETASSPRVKDEFFDQKVEGPVITFHAGSERYYDSEKPELSQESAEQGTSAAPSNKEGEINTSYLQGYQAGLESASQKPPMTDDDEEVKKLLQGKTIHEAALHGDLSRIQKLLQHYPELQTSRNEAGWTALHLAASEGHLNVIKWLASHNSSLNDETPTGYTPIHLSALNGHVDAMMILAAMGATLDIMSMDKQTPLHLAARGGNVECVKWLIVNGASVSIQDSFDRTPLTLAIEYEQDSVADILRSVEDELNDPNSSLVLIRNSRRSNLPTIDEGSASAEEKQVSPSHHSQQQKEEEKRQKIIEEKRDIYTEHHKEMEQSGNSFLDSIRHEIDT